MWRKKFDKITSIFFKNSNICNIFIEPLTAFYCRFIYIPSRVMHLLIHLKNDNNSTYVHNKNSNNNNNIGAFFWRRGEKRATVIASVLELGSTSYYLLCIVLDILFSSNHNIHKSSFGLCFWASDPLIEIFQ